MLCIDAGRALVDVDLADDESISLEDRIHVGTRCRLLDCWEHELVETLNGDVVQEVMRQVQPVVGGVVCNSPRLVLSARPEGCSGTYRPGNPQLMHSLALRKEVELRRASNRASHPD